MTAKRILIAAEIDLALSSATVATGVNKYWKNSVGNGNGNGGDNFRNVSAFMHDRGVPTSLL
jgi:hypothetical protein